ncbi:MAG: hypothetical protein ABGW74_07360 [Campylobacterales bacterium]
MNLFIVRTPLQLLNSIEARDRFHFDEKNVVFCIYRKEIDKKLMKNMLDSSWNRVFWFKLTPYSRAFYPMILKSFLNYVHSVDSVYFALVGNVISHIINSIEFKKSILFDDGNEILGIVSTMKKRELKKSKFIHKFFGKRTDSSFLYSSYFFSIYNLLEYVADDKFIQNDYRYFKKKIKSFHTKSDTIYFIGSNIVGNYLSEDIFELRLKQLIKMYEEKEILYILHRYEDRTILDNLGIKSILFENIIEYQFFKDKIRPSEILSFRSSALDTLEILYGSSVSIVSLPLDDFYSSKEIEMSELYHYYKLQNRKIIELK